MPAAIIVSHGQPSDPDPAQQDLERFAARVAAALPDRHIGAATLAKDGALDAALQAAGPDPLIYPLFMTEGWFTGDNLRKRLRAAPGARILRPLGVSPRLPGLAADLLCEVLTGQGWTAGDTQLFIAGHGSGRESQLGARHARLRRRAGAAHDLCRMPRRVRRGAALSCRSGLGPRGAGHLPALLCHDTGPCDRRHTRGAECCRLQGRSARSHRLRATDTSARRRRADR